MSVWDGIRFGIGLLIAVAMVYLVFHAFLWFLALILVLTVV